MKLRLEAKYLKKKAQEVADQLCRNFPSLPHITIYGIPRGGIPAAYLVKEHMPDTIKVTVTHDHTEADVIIDDLYDSGKTSKEWAERTGRPVLCLVRKGDGKDADFSSDTWLVFPWEIDENQGDASSHDIPIRLLQYIGENPKRGGLLETPKRMMKAWSFYTKGYDEDPADILKVFADGAESYDEMVTVRGIQIFSHCEHHLAPFFGTVDISYIPDGKIVGLSKLARLADCFARRLQVQERLTHQIARALEDHLHPLGVGVYMRCRHMCMESRGIQQVGTFTETSALYGVYRDQVETRNEFMATVKTNPRIV